MSMSRGAMPGEHLCVAHQGNHSHYAAENCTICKQQARIAELEAVLKATVPKLNRMMRMPNTEWVADEHNAAVEKLKALLGGGE